MNHEERVKFCKEATEEAGYKHVTFFTLDRDANRFQIRLADGPERYIPIPSEIDSDQKSAKATIKGYIEQHIPEWKRQLGLP